MYTMLAILTTFIFIYSITSGSLEKTVVSGAMVFTLFGILFGPDVLDLLTLSVDDDVLRLLAELTLALVLFSDAANANLRELKRSFQIPQRLILLGLPLTILLGFAVGVLIFESLTLLEIAVLATMLAATDAALGKAVIMNKMVPVKIRESLNFESGLNDGVCVPILLLFLALSTAQHAEHSTLALAALLLAQEIGIGLAVGLGMTLLGSWLVLRCFRHGWITEVWKPLIIAALALACFAVAQSLHGSGFIAAFSGGLLFGSLAKDDKHELLLSAEGVGETLGLLTWIIFGSSVISQSMGHFSWSVLVYSVLSLTVIRIVPVVLSLTGTQLRMSEKLFIGWFGPRGLATIVFIVLVLNADVPGGHTIAMTAVCTIVLSVFAHGMSALPLIDWLAARRKQSGEDSEVEE